MRNLSAPDRVVQRVTTDAEKLRGLRDRQNVVVIVGGYIVQGSISSTPIAGRCVEATGWQAITVSAVSTGRSGVPSTSGAKPQGEARQQVWS